MRGKPEHRTINFFSQDGSIILPLQAVVFSFVIFPDDVTSRVQAASIYEIEQQRYLRDPANYKGSELVRWLMTSVQQKAGQRMVAGLTMLAFQHLYHFGEGAVSRYQAAKLVEAALAEAKKADPRPFKLILYETSEPTLKGIRLPSARRDIEKAYRANESVAHILAADLLCTNSLELSPLFDWTFEKAAVLLNTAARIEEVMMVRQPAHFKRPWLVSPGLNDNVRSCGSVDFEGEIVAFLEAGRQKLLD